MPRSVLMMAHNWPCIIIITSIEIQDSLTYYYYSGEFANTFVSFEMEEAEEAAIRSDDG